MLILDTSRLEEIGIFPHEPGQFENHISDLCNESREILVKQWLPKCADILLELKSSWWRYVPKGDGGTVAIVERFFECINVLLAMQLRRLVMRSLKHFLEFIVKFKARTQFA